MVKQAADSAPSKKGKHAHPRDTKKRTVLVSNDHVGGEVRSEYAAFRRQLRGMNVATEDDYGEDDVPVNTRRSRSGKGKEKEDPEESRISWKYIVLMSMILLPGIIEMVAMSGGLYNSAQFLVVWLSEPRHAASVVLLIATPLLLFQVLPARYVSALMVILAVSAVSYPTASVYFCSPVMMNYTHFGSNYSLRLPAAEITKQAVTPCMRHFPMAVYRMSALSPQLELVMAPKDVINVNITTTHDSPLPYRLLMATSRRSVKGRWHLIYLLCKIPRRLAMKEIYTSLLEDDREEASYLVRGKLVETPKSMRPMQQQLAEDKLMRPLMMEVHGIEAFT